MGKPSNPAPRPSEQAMTAVLRSQGIVSRTAVCDANLLTVMIRLVPTDEPSVKLTVTRVEGGDMSKLCACGGPADWYIVKRES